MKYCHMSKIKAAVCLILSFIITAVSLCGCTPAGITRIKLSDEGEFTQTSAGEDYHITSEGGLSQIKASSFLELYFDSRNACVSVKNTIDGKYFYALSEEADAYGISCAFTIRIIGEDGRAYNLNSQDNCVAFSSFKTDNTQNGISVTYSLALNREDALCSVDSLRKNALRADVTILYKLDLDALCISLDTSSLFVSDGYCIEDIGLLPGLACAAPENGDFFVLPDGCGALVDLTSQAQSDISYRYYSYGADPSVGETGGRAYLPFFAFRYAGSAVCVTAEEGDAMTSFVYRRLSGKRGAAAYPLISVSQVMSDDSRIYTGDSYNGKISLRYTFLGNDNGSYIDLATVCRERLIRSYMLKAGTLELQDSIPFILTAVGAGSSDKKDSYTEFSEAKEILSILKAKGINNIAMRYMGTLSGGLSQKSMSKAKLLGFLGSKDELTVLTDYARVQKLEVFFDINLLTASKSDALSDIGGDKLYDSLNSSLHKLFDTGEDGSYLSSFSELDKNISSALKLLRGQSVSLGDVSRIVYSDNTYGLSAQGSKDYISEACRAFGVNGSIMISSLALYLMKIAKYVGETPLNTELAHEEYVTAVPFLQTVLHGTVYYAGEPLNFSGDLNYAALKCIEFGCAPSAVLTYRGLKTDYDTYYVNKSPQLAAAYERMNAELSDLYNKRITAHTQIYKDVYCTEYANTALVYVNYSNESVEINGLTLEAMDYMRVN